MDDKSLIYNSRIIKIYLEYVKKHYPDLDMDAVLDYAEMTRQEVDDQVHWFSQYQTDRFHEILVEKTADPGISRAAGRYATSSAGMGPLKKYALGLMSPMSLYLLLEKVYPQLTRGAITKVRKVGSQRVEVIATPAPGVNEKPYQCENRTGSLESGAKLFTERPAKVEHPLCFHRGDDCCRYIITWEKTPSLYWKRIRNLTFPLWILVALVSFFTLPVMPWIALVLSCGLLTLAVSLYSEHLKNRELARTIETQGDSAGEHMDEVRRRYNDALLVREIGEVTSAILDVNQLVSAVVGAMDKHLDFDRGVIMLADNEEPHLVYAAGYGYNKEQEGLLRQTTFNLDNPDSGGMFVRAFKEQKPFLLNDIEKNGKVLSERSLALGRQLGVKSLLCVSLVYEKESLGIVAVDNVKSGRPLTESDVSLLMGVASQTAVGINNARSFRKIQESEEKYRTVLEANPDPVVVYDMEGRVVYFNPAFTEVFGWTLEDCIGKKMDMFVPEESWPETRRMIEYILAGEVFSGIETRRYTRAGDEIPVSISGSIYRDSKDRPTGSVINLRDISGQKEMEAKLQRAQKMEVIGTLAGGVAHDLNNILSGIVSYPELLLMDIPEDSPLRKPLLTIQKSGERAASIVQDLLTLARRGVAVTEVVDLNQIVSDYLNSAEHGKLQSLYPEVSVETRLETGLLNVLGSPVHLSKTVMNLVSNAAEAMPGGGSILVCTENRYIDKPVRRYDNVTEGTYAVLVVSDKGEGIASQDMERIFEPFYTKKVMGRSGTGLGMAVVWGTVKDHNGYIDVQSTEGKGSTFTLFFPVTRRESAGKGLPVSMEEYMGGGESILVVDDVEEQRELASGMLKRLGYSVTSVSSGEEAVEYMKKHSADLLVLDMIMDPGIDGLETYSRILDVHPGQKAIIASGFSETERVKEAQRLGAGVYLKKPYLLEKIGQAVKTELDAKIVRMAI